MRSIAAILVIAILGCTGPRGPRTALQPPPADASFEVRRSSFQTLKALGVGTDQPQRYLELGDYRRVYEPEDLRAVVRDDTGTGRAIAKYRHARAKKRIAPWVFAGAVVVGGGMLAGGIAVISSDRKSTAGGLLTITGLLGILGGMAGSFMLHATGDKEMKKHLRTAFERYDESLAATLRICVHGTELVDCAAGH